MQDWCWTQPSSSRLHRGCFHSFSSVNLACFPNMGQTTPLPEAAAAEGNVIKNGSVSGHGVWMESLGFWLPNKDFIVVIPPLPSSLPLFPPPFFPPPSLPPFLPSSLPPSLPPPLLTYNRPGPPLT